MEKLPTTSYMRLVDIWLILGQLIPFIEVILLTLRELYNEEEDVINHHGHARSVGSNSQVSLQSMSHITRSKFGFSNYHTGCPKKNKTKG